MDGEDVGARNIMEGNQVGLFLFVVYPIHQNKRRRVVNWWSLPFHRRPRGNKKFTSVTYSWYSSSVSMTVGLPDELGGSFYKKLMHISLRIGWWQQIERTFEWKWLFMFICMSTYGRRETTGQVQRLKTNNDDDRVMWSTKYERNSRDVLTSKGTRIISTLCRTLELWVAVDGLRTWRM